MKVPTVFTTFLPKKKKQTPLQKVMQAVTAKKKRLPILKKQLVKKWRKSSLRKTLKAKAKRPMFSFKKESRPTYLANQLLQRMP